MLGQCGLFWRLVQQNVALTDRSGNQEQSNPFIEINDEPDVVFTTTKGTIMFHKNSRVQISWALYRRIIDCDLSATSFRVLIGLLLHHDDLDHWQSDHVFEPDLARAFLVLTEFRRHVGLRGNNDALAFKKVVCELEASGLFVEIRLRNCSKVIEWVFSANIFADQLDRDLYVLLTLSEVAECTTPLEYQVLCELTRVQQMNAPQFDTSYLRAARMSGDAIDWKILRKQLKRILGKWSVRKNAIFVVALLRPKPDLRVSGIAIRFLTKKSKWHRKAFYTYPPNTKFVRVAEGKIHNLDAETIGEAVRKNLPTTGFSVETTRSKPVSQISLSNSF